MLMRRASAEFILLAVNFWFTLKTHHLACEGANPERSHYPTTLLLIPPCRKRIALRPSSFLVPESSL